MSRERGAGILNVKQTTNTGVIVCVLVLAAGCVAKAPSWKEFAVAKGDSPTVIAGRFHASFKDGRRPNKCTVDISDVVGSSTSGVWCS